MEAAGCELLLAAREDELKGLVQLVMRLALFSPSWSTAFSVLF